MDLSLPMLQRRRLRCRGSFLCGSRWLSWIIRNWRLRWGRRISTRLTLLLSILLRRCGLRRLLLQGRRPSRGAAYHHYDKCQMKEFHFRFPRQLECRLRPLPMKTTGTRLRASVNEKLYPSLLPIRNQRTKKKKKKKFPPSPFSFLKFTGSIVPHHNLISLGQANSAAGFFSG